jgi:hypothetical protein
MLFKGHPELVSGSQYQWKGFRNKFGMTLSIAFDTT